MNSTKLFSKRNLFRISPEERAKQKAAFDRAQQEKAKFSKQVAGRIKFFQQSNLNEKDLQEKTFEKFEINYENKKQFLTMKNWTIDKPFGYFLCGNPGTGKSHLCKALMIELAKQGTSSRFDCLSAILKELRDFDNAPTYERTLINVDVLIIDDFGAEKTTEWAEEQLFRILEARARHRRQSFITSNLTKDELKARYHARIVDRLVEYFQFLVFEGRSYRFKIHQQNIEKR